MRLPTPLCMKRTAEKGTSMGRLKKAAKDLARRFGYEITPVRACPPADALYRPVTTSADYCPWNKEKPFIQVFSAIREHTLVDMARCYELWKLVEQSAKLPCGCLIEVGVWRGGTGALIAMQAKRCGIEEKVYLCDTFKGVVKAGDMDNAYRGGEHADTDRRTVEALVRDRMGLENTEILEGIFPDETGRSLEDVRFRFCHIDVDVYLSAREAVEWIWGRMVPGGIVVYDDYGFRDCMGVTRWVEEHAAYGDSLFIYNLNGHAIVIKLDDRQDREGVG